MTAGTTPASPDQTDYAVFHADIVALLEAARRAAARSVNAVMTASYWEIGRRIVEFEQGGKERAEHEQALLKRLSADQSIRFGRCFGVDSLESMRLFYQTYPPEKISESPIRRLPEGRSPPNSETTSRNFDSGHLAQVFPLSWPHYVHLMRNNLLAAGYQNVLPDEKLLAEELNRTRRELEARRIGRDGDVEAGE